MTLAFQMGCGGPAFVSTAFLTTHRLLHDRE